MTFSITGRSADGTALGVAVASKFLAAGAAVPAALADVGTVATQSYANLGYKEQGLRLLAEGRTAADTVAELLRTDGGPVTHRQVGLVGTTRDGATYTGESCHGWAGGTAGDGYAVQGNMLAGPQVVAEMERAWLAEAGNPRLAYRLLAALRAGDAAGGDRRGRQSAAILVCRAGAGYGGATDVLCDLRIDDHADPVAELRRLHAVHVLLFGRTPPEHHVPLDPALQEELADRLERLGYSTEDGVEAALARWAGVENLEERLSPTGGTIDPVVLGVLRERAP
jgi:uncharacterized Ntn-hydrolase superfamily protein